MGLAKCQCGETLSTAQGHLLLQANFTLTVTGTHLRRSGQSPPWGSRQSPGQHLKATGSHRVWMQHLHFSLFVEKLNISDNSDTENPTVNTVSGAQRLSHMKDGVALPKVK